MTEKSTTTPAPWEKPKATNAVSTQPPAKPAAAPQAPPAQQSIQQTSAQEVAAPTPTALAQPRPLPLPPTTTTQDAMMASMPNMQRQATSPSAVGSMLNLQPHESPIERAVELAQRLGAAEAEKAAMANRVHQLEVALETRDRMLADSAREADQAVADIAGMREQLRSLRQELQMHAGRSSQGDRTDVEALQSIRASLLKILEASGTQGARQ